jgi:hypothetical protein
LSADTQQESQASLEPHSPTTTARDVRPRIAFAPNSRGRKDEKKALYVPSPKAREEGEPFVEVDASSEVDEDDDKDRIMAAPLSSYYCHEEGVSLRKHGRTISTTTSIQNMASDMFVIGSLRNRELSRTRSTPSTARLPQLSKTVTVGRNSQFYNLTPEDRQALGGIEYRALKLLLKIVTIYFFGINLFTSICLAGWIESAPSKYREYLVSQGQNKTWWAFYSGATMTNNLGFTLTPDSMISFRDATWP